LDERIIKIKNIISNIPKEPGIYMMKDIDNKIIYVGKAIILKNRVSQYFNKNNKSVRIENMVKLVENIEYIITKNEVEALVLECNYIKQLSPKFNVLLKDDKTYPYIKININESYPTMYITRRKIEDKALYFGPYTSVKSIREVMNIIKQIFPLKRCKYNLDKTKVTPCLYYHIGRCLGPCKNDVNKDEYKKMIDQIILFLNGKTKEVENGIKEDIEKYIQKLEFEKANNLKQRLLDIEKINLKQSADNLNEVSTDVIGYILDNNNLHLQIFKIRGYKIVLHENINIENVEKLDLNDILISCISQYYIDIEDIPKKIYIKLDENQQSLLANFLDNVQVIVPKIGDKFKLIQMVENNIKINLEEKKDTNLSELKRLLDGDFETIESYDISNLKDDYIVGAMVRIDDGKLNKKGYRKFKIKSTLTQNDPLCMYEIISRRLKHTEWEYPDVIFIDGGITQVNAAKKAVNEIGLDILIYGMIKNSKHRTKGLIDSSGKEIEMTSKKALNFITFVQDEVHRFAIKYHRELRDKIV
jgi:excinuclease ABC subunit C